MRWTIARNDDGALWGSYIAETEAVRIGITDRDGCESGIDIHMTDALMMADRVIAQAWYLDENPADRLDRLRDEVRTLSAHVQATYNGFEFSHHAVEVLISMEQILDHMIIEMDGLMVSEGLEG